MACLWLAVRNVSFSGFAEALGEANYAWLLPAFVLLLSSIVARSVRWVVLLDREGQLADSFWAQSIGYLFTNILPFNAGEPARVLVMAERCKLPIVQVAASAIVERLLDVATILVVLVLVLPRIQGPDLVARAGKTFGIIIPLALIAMAIVVRFNRYFESLLLSICERASFLSEERIVTGWRHLVGGLVILTRRRVTVLSIGWSAVAWGLTIGGYWFILRAFEADAALKEAAFLQVALTFALAVPSTPGSIGVFQLAGQQALVLPFGMKYDPAVALAAIITAYLICYVLTSVLGLIGLWKVGKSVTDLGRTVLVRKVAVKSSPRKGSP